MLDMSPPTCLQAERGAWHFVRSDIRVFEPDFDVIVATRVGAGAWTWTLYTEAGILVFDMTHGW